MLHSIIPFLATAAAHAAGVPAPEGACAAGRVGDAACPPGVLTMPRGNSLLQSRRKTMPGATVSEDEDGEVARAPVKAALIGAPWSDRKAEASELALRSVTHGSGEGWFSTRHMSYKRSSGEYMAHLARDGDKNSWGGAVTLVVDLGTPYKVTKFGADWRVCQCEKPGSLVIESSLNGVDWVVAAKPTLLAWGDHVEREDIVTKESQIARFWRISTTDLAPVRFVGLWEFGFWGTERPLTHNAYGWFPSYRAGEQGLSGTEIVTMAAHKGRLYAGTGYWMDSHTSRYGEIVRLDCPFCTWTIDYVLVWSTRVEALSSVTFTTGSDGLPIAGGPDNKLIATNYMDYHNEARCILHAKNDDTTRASHQYPWADMVYFRKTPFRTQYYSSRAMALHRDSVTNVDRLFLTTGIDGVTSGAYSPTASTNILLNGGVEAGPLEARPLSMAVMDGRLYLTSSAYLLRRTDGLAPTWSIVFDLSGTATLQGTVDEAVGGIRGLTRISNPASPTGSSLLFSWNANEHSKGCIYRLDPDDEDALIVEREVCVTDIAKDYFRRNVDNMSSLTAFSISAYNNILEVPNESGTGAAVYIVGYELLLFSYSIYEHPTSQWSVAASGHPIGFYSGSGFLVRRGANNWEVREPSGPRYDPMHINPPEIATRSYAVSPFADDKAVYLGGYDSNFHYCHNTAWIQRGTYDAVFQKEVPCQKEMGCGHIPGKAFQQYGCKLCRSHHFYANQISFWQQDGTAVTCQEVMDWANERFDLPDGADSCASLQQWDEGLGTCCGHGGCDFCKWKDGQKFNGGRQAGTDQDGWSYTCATALAWTLATEEPCDYAVLWWADTCCE
mmetsp:Transcript_61914/g.191861  ORF Transcript_61914/g.191861 Transcript_61914/m.191861 type:complete len:839 (+) Transcript_61914:78-2594(+)